MKSYPAKISVLKFILLIASSLGVVAVGSGLVGKVERQGDAATVYGEVIILCLLLLSAISGFIAFRFSKILWLPTLLFPIIGFIQFGFIISGIMGANVGQVPVWHTTLLFFLLVAMPVWVGWSCFRAMRQR